jgi:two-component system nitrogen regulation sensor histidine kinase NtrY
MNTEAVQPGLGGSSAPARRSRSAILFGVGFILAAILTAATMFFAVSGVGPVKPGGAAMVWLLGASLAITVFLGGVVVYRIVKIARARPTPETGARLHLRFVSLFSAAAVAPAVIVALFLGSTLSRGIDQLLSAPFKAVVENAATVGKSYVEAATESVRGEVLAMATDLNHAAVGLVADKTAYTEYLHSQAQLRFFLAAYVIDSHGKILAQAEQTGAPAYKPPSAQAFTDARGGVVAMKFAEPDVIRALYHLRGYNDAYLFVIRRVDAGILEKLHNFDRAVSGYRETERRSGRIRTIFALAYLTTALLVLLGAVWLGLSNATSIAEPIGKLAEAARRVAQGDLDARVAVTEERDEVDALGRAFNRMTGQLQTQRRDLVQARQDAEARSGFIQAVLAGVGAGVIGLDRDGRVTAANRSAATLLSVPVDTMMGRRLTDIAPEFADLLTVLPGDAETRRVDLVREGATVHLSVRVAADSSGAGLVLTFDDMTKLIAAQREEAWKDVARRIAHEIKNPLTPIQLSAERLRRKYGREIQTDKDTFERCVDTIMRQVSDIRRMADEFSMFARMPQPTLAEEDLGEIVRETALAQRISYGDIRFDVAAPEAPLYVRCDGRLIAQALLNIIKNAAEAIESRRERDGEPKEGVISVKLAPADGGAIIEVTDNGIGLPAAERGRLTEPYVTTRTKGTGLGLAIVRRVMEDHGGALDLGDPPGGGPGAMVRLIFPAQHEAAGAALAEEERK